MPHISQHCSTSCLDLLSNAFTSSYKYECNHCHAISPVPSSVVPSSHSILIPIPLSSKVRGIKNSSSNLSLQYNLCQPNIHSFISLQASSHSPSLHIPVDPLVLRGVWQEHIHPSQHKTFRGYSLFSYSVNTRLPNSTPCLQFFKTCIYIQ